MRCGVVSQVTQPLTPRLDRNEAIRRVRAWQPEGLDSSTYGPTKKPMRKAYALTLNCNVTKEREPDWILSSTDVWVEQAFGDEALFGRDADASGPTRETESSNIRSDVSDALQCCAGRLFFCTHEGYIGLDPSDTQPDDILAIPLRLPNTARPPPQPARSRPLHRRRRVLRSRPARRQRAPRSSAAALGGHGGVGRGRSAGSEVLEHGDAGGE